MMSSYALSFGSSVTCLHGGTASPTVVSTRIRIDGQPAVLQTAPYVIAGCALPPPPAANGPCAMAQWISGTLRVRGEGMPLLVQRSEAVCAPTGTGLRVVAVQSRVRAA